MMKRTLVYPIVTLAVSALATSALAAETIAPRGFVMAAPQVDGGTVRGSVCRRASFGFTPNQILVERVTASGAVSGAMQRPISGALARRTPGCAYYAVATGWTLGAGETVRVSAIAPR